MLTEAEPIPRPSARHIRPFAQCWAPLVLAALFAPFANGVHAIATAAWLFPLFLLRFVRVQPTLVGLPIAYFLLTGAVTLQFWGTSRLPAIAFVGLSAIWGLVMLISYAVDKLITHRLTGIPASLVFPCAWVSVEYLLSAAPYGTWGSVAYSQSENLPLIQVLSVTGLWGISFLIAWFAAAVNSVWENGLVKGRAVAWCCGMTLAGILVAGGFRLAMFPVSAPTVRIASLSVSTKSVDSGRLTADEYWRRVAIIDDDLLQRTEREMLAGAKIVFWSEANAPVLKNKEADLVARGASLADRYHAYLGMSLYEIYGRTGNPPRFENKLILIGPEGQLEWSYNKTKPVPGQETALMVAGDRRLKTTNTAYGRLSGLICFDGDFPRVAAQAGTETADILLDPSNDWPAIDPLHTVMASFRAIEQGVNLVRQTRHGLSAAYDYEGRVLATADYYQSNDPVMVAWVPTRGVRTFYARFGDWFAWLNLLTVVALTFVAMCRKPTSQDESFTAELYHD
jgi:apolipoprotein N-acyltransferase